MILKMTGMKVIAAHVRNTINLGSRGGVTLWFPNNAVPITDAGWGRVNGTYGVHLCHECPH